MLKHLSILEPFFFKTSKKTNFIKLIFVPLCIFFSLRAFFIKDWILVYYCSDANPYTFTICWEMIDIFHLNAETCLWKSPSKNSPYQDDANAHFLILVGSKLSFPLEYGKMTFQIKINQRTTQLFYKHRYASGSYKVP